MIAKEIKDKLWERFFSAALSPFKREDVVKVIDMRSSPFDNDSMSFVGVFELKDKTFGMISAEYSGTWDEVAKARCLTGKKLSDLLGPVTSPS